VSEAVGALTETSRATRRGIETAHTEAEAIQGALEAMDTASQTVKEQIDTIAGQTDTMDREISQVRTLISGVSSAARELESRVGQFVTGDEE
jgi:archaellum component FlaC